MSMAALPESIILFGAGGHAKSVIAVMHAEAKWKLAGLLDDGQAESPGRVLGYEVLGARGQLARLRAEGISKGLVAVGSNSGRREIADAMEQAGFSLISIKHPTACLMTDAVVEPGSFMHAMALVGPECRVGRNAIIESFTSLGHESRIGDCVQFSAGVHISRNVEGKSGISAFSAPAPWSSPG